MLSILLPIAGLYGLIGLLFGVAFAFGGGAAKIDPAAAGGTWGFKLLVIPGCAVFWPYLLRRWRRGELPPEERSAHRVAANSNGGNG